MDHSVFDPKLLLDRVRDPDQLASLLDVYRGYLKVLARLQIGRRVQGKIDASDVVQEAFLQACRTFRQFRGTTEKELLSWLRRVLAHVLSNTFRHYYGAQRRDVRLEQEMDHELDQTSQVLDRGFFDRQVSPSEQTVRREQSVFLADALERLPDDYREVLILRHLEELRFPEIASRMERSQDSVKKLWARGLACLRRQVEAEQ